MPDSIVFLMFLLSATLMGSWLEQRVRDLKELKRARVLWGTIVDKGSSVLIARHHELGWFIGWKVHGEIIWQKADALELESVGLDFRVLDAVVTPGGVYRVVSRIASIRPVDEKFILSCPEQSTESRTIC